jgi:DNA mismatch repair ATPase MutS
MIGMPTNEANFKEFKNITRVNTILVKPLKNSDVIEQIFDIVEVLQEICQNLNSYFGKKVKLIEKLFLLLFLTAKI